MTDTEQAVDILLEALTFEVIKWNYGASSAEAAGERLKARTGIMRLISEAQIDELKQAIHDTPVLLAEANGGDLEAIGINKGIIACRAIMASRIKQLSAPPTVQHRRTEIDINGNPSTITSHYPAKATPDTEEAL